MSDAWVVTGVGMVSAAGDTPQSLLGALTDRAPLFLRRTERLESASEGVIPALPLHGFDPKRYLARKGLGNLSRTSQLACAAASRLAGDLSGLTPSEVGVVFGSAWGSLKTIVDFERATHVDGPRFVDPFLFAETVPSVPAGQVSIFFGWSACDVTLSSGATSGLAAFCTAIDLLGEGRARLAIAGGGDELNLPLVRTLLAEGKITPAGTSLPYSAGGLGPVGSEGACLLTLEADDHAAARGARPLARVRAWEERFAQMQEGGGTEPAGLLTTLLERAGLSPGEIDLVVVSAGGNEAVDRVEGRAILKVFGTGRSAPLLLAPKAILGETWAASGPLAIVAALETFRSGIVPAPPRDLVPAPDLVGLNLPRDTMERDVRHAIALDCGLNGQMAGVLLSRDEACGAG